MSIRTILIGLLAVFLLLSCDSSTKPDLDYVSLRGDINLNGLAYEIVDAVMLSDYIVQFGTTPPEVAALPYGEYVRQEEFLKASDVNGDGAPATLCDLVYMTRVVVGDAVPYDELFLRFPVTEATCRINSEGVCSIDKEMGAALVTLQGDVKPELLDDRIEMKQFFDGAYTRALIYSWNRVSFAGNFLDVPEGSVVDIEFADYYGNPVYLTGSVGKGGYWLFRTDAGFWDSATLWFRLTAESEWKIVIRTQSGLPVAWFSGVDAAGSYSRVWDADGLPAGIYRATLTAEGISRSIDLEKWSTSVDDYPWLECSPDPFLQTAHIQAYCEGCAAYTIHIFNVHGQNVATFKRTEEYPGSYSVYWNARSLPPGPYMVLLTVNGKHRMTEVYKVGEAR